MLPLVLMSPRIACRSDHNRKYLSCVLHDKSKGGNHIEASAERVPGTARTRFWMESYDEEKGLVRVRCGYNNKYWKPQEIGGSHWIVGTADEPDEELTLFQPVAYKENSIRFYHPGLQKYACVADDTETYLQLKDEEDIKTGGDDDHRPDTFTVIGLKYHKDLPQHVLFKGDNGLYLQPKFFIPRHFSTRYTTPDAIRMMLQQEPRYLQFKQEDKSVRSEEGSALHTVTTNHDGLVRIRCVGNGQFWRHRSDFLVADSQENNFHDLNTVFKVHSVDGFIALQNMGNNKFCKRLSSYGDDTNFFSRLYKEDCLSAATDVRAVQEAKLQVEEPIIERKISGIKFHLNEARRYSGGTVNKGTDTHTNINDSMETAISTFKREDRSERKWETSVTVQTREELNTKFGIDAEIELPYVKGGKVVLGYKWDKSTFNETTTYHAEGNSLIVAEERTISRHFNVKPKTVLRAIVLATQQCCDVPFSYTQTDALLLDKEVQLPPITHDDGIYTFYTWDFEIKGEEEPLSNEDTSMQGS